MPLESLREHYADLFGSDGLSADRISPDDAADPALIVCFTNRSGSNYLCELLRSTGRLGWAPEALNEGFIKKQIELWGGDAAGITSLAKYVRRLRIDLTGRGERPPVLKLGWKQLFLLAESGILDDVFPNRRLVLARRRDLMAQSVSYAIAAETGEWRSDKLGNPDTSAPGKDVTTTDVLSRVRAVLLADRHFRSFAAMAGDPVFEIAYEDVDADPQTHVDDILTFIGLEPAPIDPDAVRVARQANDRNRQLANAMVAEVSAHSNGPIAAPQRERWDSFVAAYPMTDISTRIDDLWGDDAWDDIEQAGPSQPTLLVVSPIIEDAHEVARWLLSHPDLAGPSSPVFPAEPEDAHPDGLAAHIVAGSACDGARWRVKVIRPYEFCYLIESRIIPHLMPDVRVVFVRHGDLLEAGTTLAAHTSLPSATEGIRSIAEAEQQVREVAACFGIDLEEVRLGGTIAQANARRTSIATWLDLRDDLLFAPVPMMHPSFPGNPQSARAAALQVWPRVVDHETGEVLTDRNHRTPPS